MAILPGGHAEKGLVFICQLMLSVLWVRRRLWGTCHFEWFVSKVVRFEGGSSKCSSQSHYTRPAYVNDLEPSEKAEDAEGNVEELDECSMALVNYSMCNREIGNNLCNVKDVPRPSCGPVNIYDKEGGEEMAFPWLFPRGINGFHAERLHMFPYCMYFRTRQYNYQGHWWKDISYLLHEAASHDKQLLRGEIGIYLKMTCNEKECLKGNGVAASYVTSWQWSLPWHLLHCPWHYLPMIYTGPT